MGDLARAVDPMLDAWVTANVSFVTTMVDRITPATTDDDRAEVVRQLGVDDPATVPTEPFTEWVLAGSSPTGDLPGTPRARPSSTTSGRSSSASCGCSTARTRSWPTRPRRWATRPSPTPSPTPRSGPGSREWWDAAAPHLSLPAEDVDNYRRALLDRYSNASIRHLLAQIAADGSQKIPIRAVPVITSEWRSAG